jgi:hypothetical protein
MAPIEALIEALTFVWATLSERTPVEIGTEAY